MTMVLLYIPVSGWFLAGRASVGRFRQNQNSIRNASIFKQRGRSLVDVLAALGIVGVIASLTPGITGMISSHATTAEVNGLMADLAFSRITAINTRTTVTLCASDDGLTCKKSSPWPNGWIIFTDENRNRMVDGNDRLLRVQNGLAEGTRLEYGSGYYRYLMYNPSGEVFPGATFRFCAGEAYRRAIIVYWTGRPRVSRVTSGGKPLTCPTS
jgi:type IV fimbrial biogenesis protein FimT